MQKPFLIRPKPVSDEANASSLAELSQRRRTTEGTVLCVELPDGGECELVEAKRAFLNHVYAGDAAIDLSRQEEVERLFDQHWLLEPIDAQVLVSNPAQAKKVGKRKRIRGFSLKAMLLCVTVLAIALGPYASWYSKVERQRKAMEKMAELEGFSFGNAELSESRFPWLRAKVYGDRAFGDVNSISFGKEIPDWVSDLPGVREVSVFSGVSDLSNLAKMPQLRKIQMSEREFDTVEPLRGMQHLEWIACTGSSVTDLSPLEGLPALKSLDAYGAALERGPSNIPNLDYFRADQSNLKNASGLATCPNLTVVRIEGTEVDDLSWAKNLDKLEVLKIGGTPVEDLTPLAGKLDLELGGLENTKVVDLTPLTGFKKLTYVSVPPTARKLDAIGTWPALFGLIIESNAVKRLPDLSRTSIDSVTIVDTPIDSLDFLKSVEKLRLLKLDRVPLKDLEDLPQVGTLKLYRTGIANVEKLSKQANIERLELADSPIKEISPLAGLTSLELLSIDLEDVTNFDCVASMPKLERLRLAGLPEEQTGMLTAKHIQRLALPGAEMKSCEKLPARTLQVLDLSDSSVIDVSAIADQRDLRLLSLHGTRVSNISPLEECRLITDLDLSDSDVSDISVIKTMRRLKMINLSGSKVTDISAFADPNALRVRGRFIGLSNTNVTDLSPLATALSSGTDTLDLSRNGSIDFTQLQDLPWLIELNLSKTNLQSFKQIDEVGYSVLHASHCELSDLKGIYPNVAILDISHSGVTDLSPLYRCKNLAELCIEGLDVSDQQLAELKKQLPDCNVFNQMAVPTKFSTERWLDASLRTDDLP